MKNLEIKTVEEILKGKISNNPNRFEEANGIVFSVNNMNDELEAYFSSRGIEIHELCNGIFYTETVMSVSEFEQLDYILHIKQVA